MAQDPVASRYTQAFFETAKTEGSLEETLEQLVRIEQLIHDSADLRRLLGSPDVEPDEKIGVLERILKSSWSGLVRAFLQMVVSMGRADSLPGIVDAFQAAVEADQGRLRVVVRSARHLPEAVLHRLRTRLEHQERKRIEIETEVAPGLLGGLQIRLDHRIIDGSVQRQLADLRQQLQSVRVY